MSNPLANDNIVSKIKGKFKNKEKRNDVSHTITSYLIGMNNAIDICAEACSCCWDKSIPDDFEGRAHYIAKRTTTGHSSVIEHSNFIVYLNIPDIYVNDLLEILGNSCFKYLNYHIEKSSLFGWHLLVGGSYRGYANMYMEAVDLNNPIIKAITEELYTYANSCMFEDICEKGLLNKDKFMNVEPDENFNLLGKNNMTLVDTDLYTIVGADDLVKIIRNIRHANDEFSTQLSVYDLIKFGTITVLFKNMSRTATHQLVRHRNAITQESQRYVDYSGACFTSPDQYKPEKYDPEHKYNISFAGGPNQRLTLKEIGEAECAIYGMLNASGLADSCRVIREDARAFLPSNVQCKKLYMTFTYNSFAKFLYLRVDKAAQAEIRTYAKALKEWFRANVQVTDSMIDVYTVTPKIKLKGESEYAELIGYEDSVEEANKDELKDHFTEEEYVSALGLDKEGEDLDGTDDNSQLLKEMEAKNHGDI